MTEISPRLGKRFVQPAVEIFVGIPSVVYGWIGLTILVPFIKNLFDLRFWFLCTGSRYRTCDYDFPDYY